MDPFGGSGTTALVSLAHNRRAILIELNEEYTPLIEERINPAASDNVFFKDLLLRSQIKGSSCVKRPSKEKGFGIGSS
jgi:DNA modification methylase